MIVFFLCRWVNLWPSASVVEQFTPLRTTRQPQETGSETNSPRCDFGSTEPNDVGGIVFVGNLVLFIVILLAKFFLHVLLASGVEAYWLTKVKYSSLYPVYMCAVCCGMTLSYTDDSIRLH